MGGYAPLRLTPAERVWGGGALSSTSANNRETWTSRTVATASKVATVTFSAHRSTRPMYERSKQLSTPAVPATALWPPAGHVSSSQWLCARSLSPPRT